MNEQKKTKLITSIRAHTAAFAMMGVVAATGLLNSSAQAQLIVTPSIESVTSFFGPRPPVNMVNGSGLSAGPSGILGAADSTHSNDAGQMWYSDPFLTPPDTSPIVTFNLGAPYDVQTTRLWQYNQTPQGFTVYGAAEIELSFSSDKRTSPRYPISSRREPVAPMANLRRISAPPLREFNMFASIFLSPSVVLKQPGFRKCDSSRLAAGRPYPSTMAFWDCTIKCITATH